MTFEEVERDLQKPLLGDDVASTKDLIRDHDEKRFHLEDISEPVFLKGEELIQRIQENVPRVPPGSAGAQDLSYMESVLDDVRFKYNRLVELWEDRRKELMQCLNLREFENGFQQVGAREDILCLNHCSFIWVIMKTASNHTVPLIN